MSREDFEVVSQMSKIKRAKLQPERMRRAVKEIQRLGYEVEESESCCRFVFNGYYVTYYPYTGWANGKSIKDGRGLKTLLRQLNGEVNEKRF